MSGERTAVRVRRVQGPPVFALRVCLRGGSRAESIPGQAWVAGRMLAEGTREHDWRRLAERAEARGLAIAASAGREAQQVAVDGLADDWERGLEWAAEQLYESSFPEERCRHLVRQSIAWLAAGEDDPETLTRWRFLEHLYRPHPRGRPLVGERRGLQRLGAAECAAFHAAALARGAVVAVAGRIDVDAVGRRAEELFGRRAPSAAVEPRPPAPRGVRRRRRLLRLPGADRVHLFVGRRTVSLADPRWPALRLLGAVLGDGPGVGGRIPERLREREGLAYAAHAAADHGAGLDPGRLEVYLATSPATADRAERAVAEELERLTVDGVPAAELEEARGDVIGRLAFERETAGQWADLLAAAELQRLPLERREWHAESLAAVDRAAFDRVASEFLAPGGLKTTVGEPSPAPSDGA